MDEIAALNSALHARYTVENVVGDGGTSTVYAAQDLRHGRRVAIKVLKREVGTLVGPERFIGEIALTATLQHPHVLPLFDSGEADGLLYYVMPFVTGETLRQRLEREGALPVDEVVRLSRGIASALDYAHGQGVIHRDLKPENVLLQNGEPIIADFGIALALSSASGHRITQSGFLVGTPQYMSPEQAAGERRVDARSDIYSLGAMAYEMLTGEPPHRGPTPRAVLAKIATEDARPVSASRRTVPSHIDAAVACALQKAPSDRFSRATEFVDALEGKHASPLVPPRSASRTRVTRMAAALLVLAIVVVGTAAVYSMARTPRAETVMAKLSLLPPADRSFEQIAVSPDGRRIAFTASDSAGLTQLWVRASDSVTARPVPETNGASDPFWSADSRNIGFFAGGKLKRVDVAGGAPQTVCDLPAERGGARGGTWSARGTIVFGEWEFHPSPLYEVSAAGGKPRALATREDSSQQTFHWWPVFLPDGDHFIYLGVNSVHGDRTGIYLASLSTGQTRLIQRASTSATYTALSGVATRTSGVVLYLDQETLKARELAPKTFAPTGEALVLAEGVASDASARRATISASETGVLIYGGSTGGLTQLHWFDRNGRSLGAIGSAGMHIDMRIAPDDKRAAVQREDETGKGDLWIVDSARMSRFTFDNEYHAAPVWSLDSKRLTFFAGKPWQLKQKATDGAGEESRIRARSHDLVPHDWSPDGRYLLYSEIQPQPLNADLWALRLDNGDTIAIARTDAEENFPRFSPDGRWVVYQSDQSGVNEIYLKSFPPADDGTGGLLVSAGGGTQPRWPRRSGNAIYYVARDNRLMEVPVKVGARVELGSPHALFRLRPAGVGWYDVTSDGQRFLVAAPVSPTTGAAATVVVGLADLIATRRIAR